MERINKLIRELLSTPPKKESCNCGCHSCENVGNKGPVLNESLKAKVIMTEDMRHHVKNKLPITENTFRYGSESFLNLWAEARYLYSRNAIHVNDDDKHIILETNLGEYGLYNGKKVPLDMIMEEEERGNEEDLSYAKDIRFQPLSDLLGIIINKYYDTDDKTYFDLYNELQELFTQDPKIKLNYIEILTVLKKYLTDSEVNILLTAVNAGLNEITVYKPSPINSLLLLQSQIESSKDTKEKQSLAIQCAEMVLDIFEKKYPNDNRPRKAIEAAKKCLANPTEENQRAAYDAAATADDAADDAAGNDEDWTGGDDAYYAVLAAQYAAEAAEGTAIINFINTSQTEKTSEAADRTAFYAIEAAKKQYDLNEITVYKPSSPLLSLKSRIKASKDPKEKLSIAIQCAEMVLPIWEEKYMDNNLPREAIEATKKYFEHPTEENQKAADDINFDLENLKETIEHDMDVYSEEYEEDRKGWEAAFLALQAIYMATGTDDKNERVVDDAIKATEKYKSLNEITVYKPTSSSSVTSFLTLPFAEKFYDFFKNDKDVFKDSNIPMIIYHNVKNIVDMIWDLYTDVYKEMDTESYEEDPGDYPAYPTSKEELFTNQTPGTEDSSYLEISRFLFPFITTHLKQNGWGYIDNCVFQKGDRRIDICDYIVPIADADTDPRDRIYEDFTDYLQEHYNLNESKNKKTPPLNKPHRGGSKKFYVYVRNPKTKKIKKVSFGMAGGGLHAKLNNPKARKAFASRHDCKNKKDRTKASYWSCHLPRYAKLLGIKSNFSGYW